MENLIGEKIVAARKYIGYTRKKLADEIGVHPEQLRHWEKGIRNPKYDALDKIANACQIDDWFLFDSDIPISDLKYHTYEYFVPFTNRESYYLTADNEAYIIELAEEKHMDPSAALNYLLEQHIARQE